MLKLNTLKIRDEMKRLNLSVPAVADALGVTPANVYDIFTRRPVSQADRFAELLKLDAKDLVVNE